LPDEHGRPAPLVVEDVAGVFGDKWLVAIEAD
jgi:hypothetical protein